MPSDSKPDGMTITWKRCWLKVGEYTQMYEETYAFALSDMADGED